MSTDLTGLTKLEEIIDKLWIYVNSNKNFKHFCLCLTKNWDQYNPQEIDEMPQEFNEIIVEMGIKDNERYTK